MSRWFSFGNGGNGVSVGEETLNNQSTVTGKSGIWEWFSNIETKIQDAWIDEMRPSQLNHLIEGHRYQVIFSVDCGTDVAFNEQDFIQGFDADTNGHFKTESARLNDFGDGSGEVTVITTCIQTCEPVTIAVLLGISVLALYFLHASLKDVKDIGTTTGGNLLYIAIAGLIGLYIFTRLTRKAPAA